MTAVREIIEYLEEIIPVTLAEDWDNVGFLLGDNEQEVTKIMTCLTLTRDVAEEAIRNEVDFVVTHHPLFFRPVQELTSQSVEGRTLLKLAAANVSVYSPHTGYDNVPGGINDQLAQKLELNSIVPIRPFARLVSNEGQETDSILGAGRIGELQDSLRLYDWIAVMKEQLNLDHAHYVGDDNRTIRRIAIACGAAGEYLQEVHEQNCDLFVTGETSFHTCLEARQLGISLVLLGHYLSERPAMETLAKKLQKENPQITVFASETETDPLRWV